MKKMALIGIAALSLGSLFLAPQQAEARHRHCRPRIHVHRTYVPSYSYSYSYRPSYYAPAYYDYDDGYGYSSYYDYAPPRTTVRVYAPRPRVTFHYHGRSRCYRRHTSVHFGW